jgi:hypothetical protein
MRGAPWQSGGELGRHKPLSAASVASFLMAARDIDRRGGEAAVFEFGPVALHSCLGEGHAFHASTPRKKARSGRGRRRGEYAGSARYRELIS